ncbi:SDR family oxidoreductase [Chitinophaga sp. MM2321]|uniref:SDR family NAD(P)-dependent oxidoreductase n=1 Tax=Chitinophaga sp. MM2321 TaxID=3137178 RepID=UPI0032D57EF7
MFSLKNKTALITGGGSGIGAAISILFASQGANVFIIDVDETGASKTVAEIQETGGSATFRQCNISNQSLVQQLVQEIGNVDILVNNAGIAHIGNVENTTTEDMDRLLGVNVKGVFYMVQAVIPFMKKQGGVILNMASVASQVGLADRFAYSMTKAAVVGMTLSIAKDYLSYNIRCNCISPARVHTPFVDGFLQKNYPGKEAEMFAKLSATQPIGRMGRPDEIAALALYLCADEAGFITGCDYPIDGGFIKLNS